MEYNYVQIEEDVVKVGVYSMYCNGVHPDFVTYQRRVFEFFGVKINQEYEKCEPDRYSHGAAIEKLLKTEDVDYAVIADVDTIPLQSYFLPVLLKRIHGKRAILGILFKNSYPEYFKSPPYAGCSFLIVPTKLYKELGEPSFEVIRENGVKGGEYEKGKVLYDVGQYFSEVCRKNGVELELLNFSNCLARSDGTFPPLPDGRYIGFGNIYDDIIYHNCMCRAGYYRDLFVLKCKSIIKETK